MTYSARPSITELDSAQPTPIVRVRLESPSGFVVETCNLGAALHRLWWPQQGQDPVNVVLGYETLDEYRTDPFFIGATVGRVANRIAHGRFDLAGEHYQLETNDPPHHLHGGAQGWFRKVWKVGQLYETEGTGVRFDLESPHNDAGYPGRILASVSYLLRHDTLHVVMTATSDQLTLVNLAHHSYFNLAGHGDILNHELAVFADQFTPDLITGEPKDVDGTPLDLRAPRRIGSDLPQVPGCPQGFDHNYLLQAPERAIQAAPAATAHDPAVEQAPLVARLVEPNSGRTLELSTNQPALQFYTGNYLDGRRGTPQTLQQHAGLCLESQAVPNYANVPAFAAQGTLRPGELYRHEMLLRFISP